MCLSKAYLDKNGERQLIMEDVSSVRIENDRVLLSTLFGEQEKVTAEIKEIDFMTHSILLEVTI